MCSESIVKHFHFHAYHVFAHGQPNLTNPGSPLLSTSTYPPNYDNNYLNFELALAAYFIKQYNKVLGFE